MKTINNKKKFEKDSDYYLKGNNYITVIGDNNPTDNGTELERVYFLSKVLNPNDINKSSSNRLTIIVYPGKYNLRNTLKIDTDYIDIISATGKCDVEINGLVITANDAILNGIDCGSDTLNQINAGANVVINNCKGLNYDSDFIKWKTYKALLTQSGTDAPVARVLNQDEDDYLGDIVWSYDEILSGIISNLEFNNLCIAFLENTPTQVSIQNGFISIEGFDFNNLNIEIKVRQRGTAPMLLSAETNEDGDEITLTFDKVLNSYEFEGIENAFIASDNTVTVVEIDDKTVTLTLDSNYTTESEITLSFDASVDFESFDYGLLEEITDFAVINNVVAGD